MAIKAISGCLLAVVLLSCLTDAQYMKKQSREPQNLNPPPESSQRLQQSKRPQDSGFHTCEVANHDRVQCGATGISASECEAISCCFDGQMCYYGNGVTLQCTKDAQIILVVGRHATTPSIDLETISFLGYDQNCNPVDSNSAFAIYQFPVTACGTVLIEEPGLLIYQNQMESPVEVAVGPYGHITRDTKFQVSLACRYNGISVEALLVEVYLVPPPPPVAAPGPLNVELRIASGACLSKGCVEEVEAYNFFYTDADYPVSKVLRDPVYVEVRILERTDPNIVLTLGRCWATSSPYPHSLPQWDLLINGCPYRDDRYMTSLVPVGPSAGLLYPTHHRRFVFKMFTFVEVGNANTGKGSDPQTLTPLKELVYIHCDAAVCQPSAENNCEPRCFRQRRDTALQSSVQKIFRPETTVVSSQGIIFTA